MNNTWKVDRFDGKGSFTLWQRRVKDLLVQQGLAKALKKEKPKDMEDGDWQDLESRCASTIRLSIADNILNNVIDEDSAAGLWEKLEKIYLAKTLTNKLHLKRQLYRLKMAEGGNLMEHMNVFNGILDQLERVDVKVEEEDKALLLLSSLPDSYDGLVTTMLYGKSELKVEEVQTALISHETHRKASSVSGGDSALAVKAGNRGRTSNRTGESSRGSSSSRGGGVRCYECNEIGHIRRNCPNRKKRDNHGEDGAHATWEYGDALLTASAGMDGNSRDWILDSGSTDHICTKIEHFDTLDNGVGGVLSLGDGTPCVVEGVGTVKIKMYDGVVHTLGGVKFVPKMHRNLISLSRLDSRGCGYTVRGGAMKITRGCRVIAKGELHQGLYRLVGNTALPNSTGSWERASQDKDIRRRVSFAVEPQARVTEYQRADDGEQTAGGGGVPRPPSGVNW